MASSSRRGGAGSKKSVTSGSKGKGRPAAKAGLARKTAASKRGRNSETGVIAVKRAGVLPRRGRAKAPLLLPADPEPAALAPQASDDVQPYAELQVIAEIETARAPEAEPVAEALPETAVADDITEEMPLAELLALTTAEEPRTELPLETERPAAAAVEPEAPAVAPPAAVPAAGPTGVSWLMAQLRRLAGARA
jgi:hypothetical protein